MAKRQSEFRPDSKGLGLFHKLYFTKKQRQTFLRWFLMAVVLLVASLLQDVILCRMDVFGATTDLVPCAIFVAVMILGIERGSLFALLSACFYAFSGTAPGYYVIAVITILCICGSMFRQSYLHSSFSSCLLCAGVCMLLYKLIVFGIALLLGQAVIHRIGISLVSVVLSLIAIPLYYPIFRRILRIGGDLWKD
jgi:uncharacterized membrane protein